MIAMALRHVTATRYVLPLREGGSLPGLVEADDLGHLRREVPRRRPGPQGAGRRGRSPASSAAGSACRCPSWSSSSWTRGWRNAEPDQEVQDLLRASPGANLGMDFLPGSLGLEVPADGVDARARRAGRLVRRADR